MVLNSLPDWKKKAIQNRADQANDYYYQWVATNLAIASTCLTILVPMIAIQGDRDVKHIEILSVSALLLLLGIVSSSVDLFGRVVMCRDQANKLQSEDRDEELGSAGKMSQPRRLATICSQTSPIALGGALTGFAVFVVLQLVDALGKTISCCF